MRTSSSVKSRVGVFALLVSSLVVDGWWSEESHTGGSRAAEVNKQDILYFKKNFFREKNFLNHLTNYFLDNSIEFYRQKVDGIRMSSNKMIATSVFEFITCMYASPAGLYFRVYKNWYNK